MVREAAPEQIKSVCEEVKHLIDRWAPGDIDERDIRSGSNTIRRLFVYDELHKVWSTLIGSEPYTINAKEILITDESQLKYLDLYTCSEVTHRGSTIYTILAFTGKSIMTPIGDGKFRDTTNYGARVEEREFTLSQFKDSICVIAEGKRISRNWLIQYVANSLGGAHFGPSSKKSNEFLVAMKKLKKFDVGNMPCSTRELLGVGQALCRSRCTEKLMSAYSDWSKENPNVRIA